MADDGAGEFDEWARHRESGAVDAVDHRLVRELCREVGPLATTSANRHREPTPPDAQGVADALGDGVALVLDGGVCEGDPSTVVSVLDDEVTILREGRIPVSDLLR